MKDLPAFRFWAFAATFGALWGAAEITVGSFLHAIRLPFGSVGLAGVGVALLMSLRILVPVRGIVLSAGVVCAAVKMLSPAGVIIGPMVGIMMEALLVEIALLPFGANVVSGAFAGVLACLWTVAQKLTTQALFFGMPVAGIYQGLAQQAERLLRLPASGGLSVIVAFLLLVATFGMAFGMTGTLIGRWVSKQLAERGS